MNVELLFVAQEESGATLRTTKPIHFDSEFELLKYLQITAELAAKEPWVVWSLEVFEVEE